jgi:hypothetical protein
VPATRRAWTHWRRPNGQRRRNEGPKSSGRLVRRIGYGCLPSLGERGVRATGPGPRLLAAVARARLKLLNRTAVLSRTVPLVTDRAS